MKGFKDIPGYEGLYKIDRNGNVYSCYYGRILKGKKSPQGYRFIELIKDGVKRYTTAHRLVAATYLGLDLNDRWTFVCHKDETLDENGFLDNSVDNLFLGTPKDNIQDMIRKGRNKIVGQKGAENPYSHKVYQYNNKGELVSVYGSHLEVVRRTGFSKGNIEGCIYGHRKTAYGYVFSEVPLSKEEVLQRYKKVYDNKTKQVVVYNNGHLYGKYKSIRQAAVGTGVNYQTLRDGLRRHNGTFIKNGFTFIKIIE